MRIHKEGYGIIITFLIIGILIDLLCFAVAPSVAIWITICTLLLVLFTVRFFRVPERFTPELCPSVLYSPADGTVVAIEEVFEDEYLQRKVIKVSIFMSIWNVHINWFPVSGSVEYFRHHDGKYLVAWHEKSSTLNERTTTVVKTNEGNVVLFRQIAGFIARRIVNRTHVHQTATQCEECGFIKFGSRVDLFLPLDTEIMVKLGEDVVGTQTMIARFAK